MNDTDQLLKQIGEIRHQAQECRDTAVVNVLDACRDHVLRAFVPDSSDPLVLLNKHQRETVLLLGKGYAPGQVAEMLHVSPSAISQRKREAFSKLYIETDIDLVLLLVRHGLVVP